MIEIPSIRGNSETIVARSCNTKMRKLAGCGDDPNPHCMSYSCGEGGMYYMPYNSLYQAGVSMPGSEIAWYPISRRQFKLIVKGVDAYNVG